MTVGIVPARTAASRFPGKPLAPICGRPMLEHVVERAGLYDKWDGLFLATCDEEIRAFGESRGYGAIMTADTHTGALDRVAEAVELCGLPIGDNDIVVCVQGDEPMLGADMLIDHFSELPDAIARLTGLSYAEAAAPRG